MTSLLPSIDLPRPDAGADAGALDARFYDLVEARVRRVFADNPVTASYLGVHDFDDVLGDSSRDAVLAEIDADKAHLAAVEAIDPARLSAEARFERDLEIHNLRLQLFQSDEVRQWERRTSAAGDIGDAVFALFARGAAPLGERLGHIASRLEAAPAFLLAARTRAVRPQVAAWQRIDQRYAHDLPRLFEEVRAAGAGVLDTSEAGRLDRAIEGASAALADHDAWLEETVVRGAQDWPLGSERYDELLRRRALDDLDADGILEIGWEQLRRNHEGRKAALRELDHDGDEASLIERLKSDHPARFEEALEAYKDTMRRARAYLIEHDLATIPAGEEIEVMATPEYLRSVMPFAAYFSPARFDADHRGIYVVTPAVDDDPNAMREHYYASISNTSIHEAYPGHHLQLAAAEQHPSLTRMLAEAPEFVEGWGMYSEQMMREEGFDAGPAFRAAMYTDAIWRSCRIILDIRMHRGELTPEEATDFLVEHTSFEVANARAEVRRYTYTPGYQLSYLLGKVLILGLREEERRRLGSRFSLKRFHDTLLTNGSIPVSFHRRLLRAGDGG